MRTHSRALLALVVLLLGLPAATPAPADTPTTSITVDGTSPGRTFDGVGAISGGGGNTRLLLDYPEPQRSRILDQLFSPGQGAALQILKVEIGGDTNSTDGAEASIEHTRGAIDCDAGYEWWLMAQAKARNPAIKLYALSWGAPGWAGTADGTFWSHGTVDYLTDWLGCAKQHGLAIDYLGGWNERGYDSSWYQDLHAALAARGYGATQVVGADDTWAIAGAMRSDAGLAGAVDIVGTHYPCGYLSAMTSCPSTADARATGKRLWASENGSQDAESGAAPMARAINRGYLDGAMTAFINWPLVAALYPNLGFSTDGLVTANQPWSGAYTVGRSAWVTAQTTQFTAPGWQYLDTASGYLGGDRANGSYVSYAAPDRSAWSTVLETTTARAEQTVTLRTAGGLPEGPPHLWSTDLSSPTATAHLVREPDPVRTEGGYRLTLEPGRVYTATSTTGQGAGGALSPQRAPLALPYADPLDGTGAGPSGEVRYLSAMNGAFRTVPCAGGRPGDCLRQQAQGTPVRWTDESNDQPYAILGDLGWSDYTVGVDALLEQPGTVDLLGRVGTQGRNNNGLDAYHLRLDQDGHWTLLRTDTAWGSHPLAAGTAPAPGLNSWHHLALAFRGTALTASLDGAVLAETTDDTLGAGQIGLGTGGYQPAQFSGLTITPNGVPARLDGSYRLVNAASGRQLAADSDALVQGDQPVTWRLTGTGDGYYTVSTADGGRALTVPQASTVPGTQLRLAPPTGGPEQQWRLVPAGQGRYTLQARSDGDLADVEGASSAPGARVVQWPANGGANQSWRLVTAG
ncbi:RICIN domain-containing protein [Kitasatospora sp. NPDC006697]|uniref:RICIN domain-containing protein n=1 Tax=Kitasatospora sp. NPDC006697 TaxID=3364020 RepID=UPI0036AF4847